MRHLLTIVAAFVLVGCEPSELRPIAVGGAAGGAGYSAPPASQPAQRPIAPGAHKILPDPEAQQEPWSDVVWASSKAKAEEACRNMAAESSDRDATVQFDSAEQLSQKPNKLGKYAFRCWFTSFIRSYDDERNHDN